MALDDIVLHTTCPTQAFFACTPDQLRNGVVAKNELEDKKTLAFFDDNGCPISDVQFIIRYNQRNSDRPIHYVGKLMENALKDEGIISFGTELDTPYTKNLVSYCFEDITLPDDGTTIRIRHEEIKDPNTGIVSQKAPDTSTKFLLEQGNTKSRGEFETTHDFVRDENGGTKFLLSFVPIMEQEVQHMNEHHGPIAAMRWLKAFTDKVGFDFRNKRERTNLNGRRTQPYAVMYTRFDHTGELIREMNDKPKLFKTNEISKEDQLKGIKPANEIVFMFCLDVMRTFKPGESGKKIMRDNEWEYEHQDEACKFTPGSIKSSDGVTREEIDAMEDYLEALETKVMQENFIGLSPLSGMNKDRRARKYLVPEQLTLRGRTDNFIVQEVDGLEHLLELSPIINKAYKAAEVERANRPILRVRRLNAA
jgi:hypothetical protein